MDNKMNNMLEEFFKNTSAKDDKELNKELQKFMLQYNEGQINYENTILDDAYELLDKAEKAKTKSQSLKLAKQAYDMCPDCFDALLFQVNLEDNAVKREKLLNEGLEYEKERLENENYFVKSNIGAFYGIYETRPYIRGLNTKVSYLLIDGKIKQARDLCKEIIKLNNSDNLGARYSLMAIYAYLEEEKPLLDLYEKYKEENLEMLFPFFALYYKLGDYKKAREFLSKIDKANPHFIKLFKGTIKQDDKTPVGYYAPGEASEVIMYFEQYDFLIDTIPTIKDFIIDNIK